MAALAEKEIAEYRNRVDQARRSGPSLLRSQRSLNAHLGAPADAPKPGRRLSRYAVLNQQHQQAKVSLADQVKKLQGNPHAQAKLLIEAAKNNRPEYNKFNRWDLVKFDGARNLKSIQGLNSLPLGRISAKGADFSGADLRNANMTNGSFDNAVFSGAKLDDAKMGGASMNGIHATNAAFNKADMQGASLGNATFTDCSFSHTNMRNVDAMGVNILGGTSLGLDMQGAKAPGMTITGRHNEISLPDDLREANLGGLTAVNPRSLGDANSAKTQPRVMLDKGPMASLLANPVRPAMKPWAGLIAAPGFV